jgi:MFS family permease
MRRYDDLEYELPSQWQAWCIWGAATTFTIYQLAIQIGYGALESGIDKSLSLNLVQSAVVSGSFLFVYSLMQLPAGLLLDRFSPRLLVASSATLCGIAAYGFAHANSFGTALLFRSALGGLAAFGFPAAGLLGRRWIHPARFVLAMGLIDFFFGLGAIGGDSGFGALLANHFSWRDVMILLTFCGIGIGILCALVVRDRPPYMQNRSATVHLWTALRILLRTRQVVLATVFYAGMVGVLFGFGGLWDIRLQMAFGFNEEAAVNLNSWIFVGLALSAPVSGLLADRTKNRQPLLLIGAVGSLVAVLGLIFIPLVWPYAMIAIHLCFTGMMLGTSVGIFGVACDAVPERYSATTIGLINAAGCFLGAVLQVLPAMLLGTGKDHALAVYQQVLSVNLLALTAAVVAALLIRKSTPKSRSPTLCEGETEEKRG